MRHNIWHDYYQIKQKINATLGRKKFYLFTHLVYPVDSRSWSRYVQMYASYLTIQRKTLLDAFEIRFQTVVYELLETRETFTLTPTLTMTPTRNPNGKLFESDYWQASCSLHCKLADAHLYISRSWSSGDRFGRAYLARSWCDDVTSINK